MPLESATYISQLVPANPVITDGLAGGYAQLNLIKQVLQNQFSNLGTVVVSATATQINNAASAISSGTLSVPSHGTVASGELDLLGLTNGGGTIVAGRVEFKNVATAGAAGSLSVVMTGTADTTPVTSLTLSQAGALLASTSLSAPSILKGGNELIPVGVIVMWSGSVASIPAGWALCDGTGGTPNLVGKFVTGAGTSPTPGTNGGSFTATGTAASQGSHNHGGIDAAAGSHSHAATTGSYVMQVADLPLHTHTASSTDSGHAHTFTMDAAAGGGGGGNHGGVSGNGASVSTATTTNAAAVITTTVDAAGGGGNAHAHTISADGTHQHVISSDGAHTHTVSVTATPPYYALCYIMKTT